MGGDITGTGGVLFGVGKESERGLWFVSMAEFSGGGGDYREHLCTSSVAVGGAEYSLGSDCSEDVDNE